jgi:glycosyltransferase involved in cell wall biosynthesis
MTAPAFRVGVQQRVLPAYRAPFVDGLANALPEGLAVFAGFPQTEEHILSAEKLETARWTKAQNLRLGSGWWAVDWQLGWRQWLRKEALHAVILEPNPRYLSNYLLLDRLKAHKRRALGWSLGPIRGIEIIQPVLSAYYSQFDALISYSHNGAENFLRLGIPAERIFIAPNAVNTSLADRLSANPDAVQNARVELGLEDRPIVLAVGRLQPRKRIDLLISALAQVAPDSQLLIVGEGPDRPRLEALAAQVFPAARFLGDRRSEALGQCFLAADLFVMPGTGGLALQEALSYGKPAVAAEADGSQRGLIHPGVNGWLMPAGSEDALVAILQDALSDRSRLRAMGAESRRVVRQTATLDRMIGGFLDALRYVEGLDHA